MKIPPLNRILVLIPKSHMHQLPNRRLILDNFFNYRLPPPTVMESLATFDFSAEQIYELGMKLNARGIQYAAQQSSARTAAWTVAVGKSPADTRRHRRQVNLIVPSGQVGTSVRTILSRSSTSIYSTSWDPS